MFHFTKIQDKTNRPTSLGTDKTNGDEHNFFCVFKNPSLNTKKTYAYMSSRCMY